MRLGRCDTEVVEVVLSRRNVLALLAKASGWPRGSTGVLTRPGAPARPLLVVRIEPDDVHYTSRQPGAMHRATVAFIAASNNDSR